MTRYEREGFKAAKAGQPLSRCPYPPSDAKREWEKGWLDYMNRNKAESPDAA